MLTIYEPDAGYLSHESTMEEQRRPTQSRILGMIDTPVNADELLTSLAGSDKVQLIMENLDRFDDETEESIMPYRLFLPPTLREVTGVMASEQERIAFLQFDNFARIENPQGNRVEITELRLDKETGAVSVDTYTQDLEEYEVYRSFDGVDLITQYHVIVRRCMNLGYTEKVARRRLEHLSNTLLYPTKDKHSVEHIFRMLVESAVAVGLENIPAWIGRYERLNVSMEDLLNIRYYMEMRKFIVRALKRILDMHYGDILYP